MLVRRGLIFLSSKHTKKSPLPSVGGDEGEGGPKGANFVHPHPHPPPSKGEAIGENLKVQAY